MSGSGLVASVHVKSRDARYAQDVRAGKHAMVVDEPEALGGADAGPPPFAMFLAALGACTSITLRMYTEKKGWDVGHIGVDCVMTKDDAGLESIVRKLKFEKPPTDEQRARILEIADKTPVTKVVLRGTKIATSVE